MSFKAVLALLPVMLLQSVVPAAAQGALRFLTIAGHDSCSGHDLTTIGFIGTTGAECTSLTTTEPTDFWLDYTLLDCSVNLFAEAGCARDSFVARVLSNNGQTACLNVEAGFRALNVTCTPS